ncbi:MAG: Lrp/AsnC family transcriptional regulator [Rhodocyclaceae bacterium]
MDATSLRLLNDYQRHFPRVDRPFAAIGAELGMDEAAVIQAYEALCASGHLSRIGPVFAAGRAGRSALVAMAVPDDRLEQTAEKVNALPEVNHNYQREHHFNLWAVVAAPSAERFDAVLRTLGTAAEASPLVLPMIEAYHIDLGFDLCGGDAAGGDVVGEVAAAGAEGKRPGATVVPDRPGSSRRDADALSGPVPGTAHASAACALPALEQALLAELQNGLPLCPRPFANLGERVGLSAGMTLELLERVLDDGLIRRFGVVVRHHELGYRANAMCVWDVPDSEVRAVGARLAREAGVTLCYRRARALPHWRYNLFCMIHGRARDEVEALRDTLASRLGLDAWPHAVLFSVRRFKQCGGRYFSSGTA